MCDELEAAQSECNRLWEKYGMFEPKEISPVHHKRLLDLNNSVQAIQRMMQMFAAQCEAKLSQYQSDVKQVWGDIQKDTGIDLDNVLWEPHPTEPKVVPTQANLRASSTK